MTAFGQTSSIRGDGRRRGREAARRLSLLASDRVLVLAPHPDDESLAAAGLLQHARGRGAAIRVVFLTDGDRNPWAQLVNEWRWPVGAAAPEPEGRFPEVAEQESSGVSVLPLRHPDPVRRSAGSGSAVMTRPAPASL